MHQHVTERTSTAYEEGYFPRWCPERDVGYVDEVSTQGRTPISIRHERRLDTSSHDDRTHDYAVELSDLRALEDMLGPGIRVAARENQRQEQVANDLRAEIKSLRECNTEMSSKCAVLEKENEQLINSNESSKHKFKSLEDDLQASRNREQEQALSAQQARKAAEIFAAEISALSRSQAFLIQQRDEAVSKAQTVSQKLVEVRMSLQAEVILYDEEQHDGFIELLKRLQAFQEKKERHTTYLMQQISKVLPTEDLDNCMDAIKSEQFDSCRTDHSDVARNGSGEQNVSPDNSQDTLGHSCSPARDPRKRPRLG